jgi:cell division protein FtsW (lipid II flippase)
LALQIRDPLSYLRRYKYIWLTLGLLLTCLTFVFGTFPGGNGPRLWLGCCGVYLQPSEPLKFLLVAFLAAYLADRRPAGSGLYRFILPSLFLTGLALFILLIQRDLGTASLFFLLFAALLYIATGRRRILVISVLLIIMAGLAGYRMFDVVHLRVDAWINPWIDPSGRSYQIVQSLIAFANGEILGRGLGLGSPSLVPVAHSDFIFAAIGEEGGLLGSVGLIAVMGLLTLRGLLTALRASNQYARYLTAGLVTYLAGQSILIAAGNLRLLPLTGVTLPFLSYGGSSLLTSFMALFAILTVSNNAEHEPPPLAKPAPYLNLALAFSGGFLALALAAGWWSVWRGPALLTRNDNARRSINDRYVLRGSLVDRSDQILTVTSGVPGAYQRETLYPPLSVVLGYTHPAYGQAALEASLDGYLRGLVGNSPFSVWWNQLLYGQPPPGLDVRLSLSLALQKHADALLADNSGAIIVMNAQTGEILVMASHPGFDANSLDQNWASLIVDPGFPLINRSTQGSYPPGTALAPFLLAESYTLAQTPELPGSPSYSFNGKTLQCSLPVTPPYTWANLASSGCPAANIALAGGMDNQTLKDLYSRLGFYTAPALKLPVAQPAALPAVISDPAGYALGQENLTISPMQMALAAASLSNQGVMPSPRLVLGVKTNPGGWSMLPAENTPLQQVFTSQSTAQTIQTLAQANQKIWRSLGLAQSGKDKVATWYIGGTLPGWQGAPLAVVVLLEENNPVLADQIGQGLFNSVLAP